MVLVVALRYRWIGRELVFARPRFCTLFVQCFVSTPMLYELQWTPATIIFSRVEFTSTQGTNTNGHNVTTLGFWCCGTAKCFMSSNEHRSPGLEGRMSLHLYKRKTHTAASSLHSWRLGPRLHFNKAPLPIVKISRFKLWKMLILKCNTKAQRRWAIQWIIHPTPTV